MSKICTSQEQSKKLVELARDGGVEILVDGEIQESIKFVHI